MSQSSIQIESQNNVVRVNNGSGFSANNFYKLKFIKSVIVQGTTSSIPNTAPVPADVVTANNGLTTDVNSYCATNFPYGTDWLTATKYICYESNRDIMNAAGANISRLHAQVDVYQIVQQAGNDKL